MLTLNQKSNCVFFDSNSNKIDSFCLATNYMD